MSSSVHATNRANNIYVMGKEFIQGINDTTIDAEELFHNNFTEHGVKFVLIYITMVIIVIYLLMVDKN